MNINLFIVAIVIALPPTLIATLALYYAKKNGVAIEVVHKTINSRMDELLISSKFVSKTEGIKVGKIEEREEVAQRKRDKI